MAKKPVFCIASCRAQVERITNQLTTVGFSGNDISVLFPDKIGIQDFAHEQHTQAPEDAATGAGMGGVLGGGLGWLVGIGALTIPGVGPFVAAGPIRAALAGAAAGGITRALVGFGITESEAKQYEGKICAGNVLISVHAEDGKEVDRAKEIFKREGATDICHSGNKSAEGLAAYTHLDNFGGRHSNRNEDLAASYRRRQMNADLLRGRDPETHRLASNARTSRGSG